MSLDATGLAEHVGEGEVTATMLLALARERAARVNPLINAIVAPIDVADARAADPTLSGPFVGVPFLIKDLVQEYKGVPTSFGSRAYAGYVATEHSRLVQRFLDAGLVMFGRTNTPEFGIKSVTEPECWGPARNPWNTARTSVALRAGRLRPSPRASFPPPAAAMGRLDPDPGRPAESSA